MAYYNVETLTITTTQPAAQAGMHTVNIRKRINSTRVDHYVQLPDTALAEVATNNVGSPYAAVLDAVYKSAMETVLANYLRGSSIVPTSIPAALFALPALTDILISGNSAWLEKEELTKGWNSSATLKAWYARPDWKTNGALRTQVAAFSDSVCKLSAKNAGVSKAQAERILAKIDAVDLDTDWGAFVARRCQKIIEAPVEEISEDLL